MQTNHTAIPIIVDLPHIAKAEQDGKDRLVYAEVSRDNVIDRENEIVALDALWDSRKLFLEQGNIDIAHWSWLANPLTGRPDPGYVIGKPIDVSRTDLSLFMCGSIFKSRTPPPQGSPAFTADQFWHSIYEQDPPMPWFSSVYGNIKPGGVQILQIDGKPIRKIVGVEWYSVGFAQRAQHPLVGQVSTTPLGNLAKADQGYVARAARAGRVLHFNWNTFAKAVAEGVAVSSYETNPQAMTGLTALRRESLDPEGRHAGLPDELRYYNVAKVAVLRHLKNTQGEPTLEHLTKLFKAIGHGPEAARSLMDELQSHQH